MYDETFSFETTTDAEDIATTVADTVAEYFTDDTTTDTSESNAVVVVPTPPPVNGVPCFLDFVHDLSGLEIILDAVALVVFGFLIGVIYNLAGGDRR